jgi:hypothetical protein
VVDPRFGMLTAQMEKLHCCGEFRQHPDRQNGHDGQHRPKLAPALRKEPSDVKLMVGLRQSKR